LRKNHIVKIRVFVREATAEHLRDIAETWGLSTSLVARAAIEEFLAHPERQVELLVPMRCLPTEDTRTPAQQAVAARYFARLAAVDLEEVAAQLAPPGGQE
jgi:hypothetical protein